jgi:hypothetical protein
VDNGGGRIRELQRAITSLRGVRGARVSLDASGIGHVRVLVVPERSVADTIRDVRSLALRRLRVDIDPARIEVISAGIQSPDPRRTHRRKLASLSVERNNGRFTARIALDFGGDRLVGASEARSVRKLECRSVAGAVIDGVRELLEDRVDLDEVDLLSMGDMRLAVVTLHRDRGMLHALNRLLR